MSHHYTICITTTGQEEEPPLAFPVKIHDDLLAIIERVRAMEILPSDEAPAFALGLKLFAETFIRHRKEPLFADLSTAFPAFMKKLKDQGSLG